VNVGIKSTALLFGDNTKQYLKLFSIIFATGMSLSGYAANLGFGFYGGVFLTTLNLLRQIENVNYEDTKDCMEKFIENKYNGLMIFIGILIGKIF
jgi:4-hydroxybenzoate polyprenyltransferase